MLLTLVKSPLFIQLEFYVWINIIHNRFGWQVDIKQFTSGLQQEIDLDQGFFRGKIH